MRHRHELLHYYQHESRGYARASTEREFLQDELEVQGALKAMGEVLGWTEAEMSNIRMRLDIYKEQ
jgi:hypothetical protein